MSQRIASQNNFDLQARDVMKYNNIDVLESSVLIALSYLRQDYKIKTCFNYKINMKVYG